jgi:hypothetical protein
MIVTWTTLQIEIFLKNWFCVCHNLYHSKEMDLWACFPSIMDLWACFPSIMDLWACFHLSWIYEHAFFISIMDLWACFFHLLWIYEHAFFIYSGFMRMFFTSIVDLWACFHLSFFMHSITSSICMCWQIVP